MVQGLELLYKCMCSRIIRKSAGHILESVTALVTIVCIYVCINGCLQDKYLIMFSLLESAFLRLGKLYLKGNLLSVYILIILSSLQKLLKCC